MLDDGFVSQMCFLSDIFHHLYVLNLTLQGRDKTVVDLIEKLTLFSSDSTKRMLHFPTLHDFIKSSTSPKVTPTMSEFVSKLRDNFATRFNEFDMPTVVLHFVRDPFSKEDASDISAKAHEFLTSLDKGSLQLEIIDMQVSSELKHAYENENLTKFWIDCIDADKFPNAKRLAVFVLALLVRRIPANPAYLTQMP